MYFVHRYVGFLNSCYNSGEGNAFLYKPIHTQCSVIIMDLLLNLLVLCFAMR